MEPSPREARQPRELRAGYGSAALLASALLLAGGPAAFAAIRRSNPPPPPALGALIHLLQVEEHSTFTASYVMEGTSGHSLSFPLYHRGADERVDLPSGGEVLLLGTSGYLCTQTQTHPTCVKEANSYLMDPVAAMVTPQVLVADLIPVEKGLLQATSVSTSNRTVAGQHALCVVITHKGSGPARSAVVTYCATRNVLAYVGTSAGVIRLTHFASSAPASLFVLPKGAVVSSAP